MRAPVVLSLVFAGVAHAQSLDELSDPTLPAQELEQEPAAVPVLTDLSPRDTRVLLGEELIRRGFRTLGEALAVEAGFARERTSRGWRYSLRGVPAGAQLVVDGVPQVVDGERDVLDVDDIVSLVDVDRVEIVRGPVTALSGAGALTGVVRITTTKPGLTGAGVRVAGSWLLSNSLSAPGAEELAAHGTLRGGDVGARVSARLWGGATQLWRVDGAPTRYETISGVTLPVTKEARDVVVDDEGATVRAVAQMGGPWGDVVVDGSAAHHVERSPISAFSHGLVDADPQTIQRDIVRARARWRRYLGPLHIDLAAFVGRQTRVDVGPLFPTRGVFADGGELRVDNDATSGGAVLRVDLPLIEGQRVVIGALGDVTSLNARSSSSDPRTGQRVDDAVSLDDLTGTGAAAVEWQADFGGSVHATAGVVGEVRTALGPSLAPRAALAWTPDDFALRLSYAEGTRAPDRYDIVALAQTVVDGRAAGAGANPALRPEHVRTLELQAAWAPSPLAFVDVRAFALRHEDAFTDVVERGLLVPINLAPRVVVGGEATAAAAPFSSDALTLEGTLAVARTIEGPSIDADLLQATAGVRASPVDVLRVGARARAGYRDVTEQATALLDVWIATVPSSSLAITLSLTNVLDANELSVDREAPPQADDGVFLPSPGRTLTLSVEGRL